MVVGIRWILVIPGILILPPSIRNQRIAFMSISLMSYLRVSAGLFAIGLFGLVSNQRSVILVLMSIELMLLAVNLQWLAFSAYRDDRTGQVFALYVLTVAAAESAIGLAILVVFFRVRGTATMETMHLMHG